MKKLRFREIIYPDQSHTTEKKVAPEFIQSVWHQSLNSNRHLIGSRSHSLLVDEKLDSQFSFQKSNYNLVDSH